MLSERQLFWRVTTSARPCPVAAAPGTGAVSQAHGLLWTHLSCDHDEPFSGLCSGHTEAGQAQLAGHSHPSCGVSKVGKGS